MALVLREEQTELYDQQLVVSAEGLLPVLEHALETGVSLNPPARARRCRRGTGLPPDRPLGRGSGRLGRGRVRPLFPTARAPSGFSGPKPTWSIRPPSRPRATRCNSCDPLAERGEGVARQATRPSCCRCWRSFRWSWLAVGWITRGAAPARGAARRDGPARQRFAEPARRGKPAARAGRRRRHAERLHGAAGDRDRGRAQRTMPRTSCAPRRGGAGAASAACAGNPRSRGARASFDRGRASPPHGQLVGRLLQLARADAGIGRGEAPIDAARLLPHVLAEIAAPPAGWCWTCLQGRSGRGWMPMRSRSSPAT